MTKFLLSIRPIVASLVVFLLIGFATILPVNWDFVNPLAQAFGDFELTDIVFSDFKSQERDTNIVIVNIGTLDRAGIAMEINKINEFQPAVIGLDAIFRKPKDTFADSLLQQAIQNSCKVTLVAEAINFHEENGKADSISTSNVIFSSNAKIGLSNLDSRGFRTVRNFAPQIEIQGKNYQALAVALAQQYDSTKNKAFLERKNIFENINYRGNLAHFYRVLDVADVMENPDLSFLKNKIVLMGYVNLQIQSDDPSAVTDISDAFFTPMNARIAGRSIPDMNGVIIHANILSMILNNDFIYPMTELSAWFWSIIFCWLNCVLCMWFLYRKPLLFGIFVRIFQLFQSLIFLYLTLWLFENYRYQFSMGLILGAIALSPDVTEWVIEIWDRFTPFEEHGIRKKRWKNLKIDHAPEIHHE